MKLGRAYEVLKDESKRREYDLIYPTIKESYSPPQPTRTYRPAPTPAPSSGELSDESQVAAIRESKQKRDERWWAKKSAFESSILELEKDIQQLGQEIEDLNGIIPAAEAANRAKRNNWGSRLLPPIRKTAEDKDRERQERKIEIDMKERQLRLKKKDLKKTEFLFRRAKEEGEEADLVDHMKMRVLQDRIWDRETRERQERVRVLQERIWARETRERQERVRMEEEKIRKQQQEQREK